MIRWPGAEPALSDAGSAGFPGTWIVDSGLRVMKDAQQQMRELRV